MLEGERVKALIERAKSEIILCAPFIKVNTLRLLIEVADPEASLKVVTRWRAVEVAAGVSDLQVFDLLKDRIGAELLLLNELHAKLYVADQACLVGSANLTGAALGWSSTPNVEILIDSPRGQPQIQRLISEFDNAVTASNRIRSEIQAQADALGRLPVLGEADIEADDIDRRKLPWLPRCAAPEKLIVIYRNTETRDVTEGTRLDGIEDLKDLGPPPNLSSQEFTDHIKSQLESIPSIGSIIERVQGRISDGEGTAMIIGMRPQYDERAASRHWRVVRDWIAEFFQNDFEVAPQNYILRPKQKT